MVRKITEPGDWGSGTPAGTDLPPRGQPGRREGSPTKLRRKVGQEPMEVVAWAQEKNQKKQSLTVSPAGLEGLCPEEGEGGLWRKSSGDCGWGGGLTAALSGAQGQEALSPQ